MSSSQTTFNVRWFRGRKYPGKIRIMWDKDCGPRQRGQSNVGIHSGEEFVCPSSKEPKHPWSFENFGQRVQSIQKALKTGIVTFRTQDQAKLWSGEEGTYLELILAWVGLFVLLLWTIEYQVLVNHPSANNLIPITVLMFYLRVADNLALRRGTWTIESRTKLRMQVWDLRVRISLSASQFPKNCEPVSQELKFSFLRSASQFPEKYEGTYI